jgi:YHS domain-containing protein
MYALISKIPLVTKTLAIVLLILSIIPSYAASQNNVNKEGIGLSGYDPVSYFMSAPMKGYPALKYTYKGTTYQFENEENRQAFIQKPEKYSPAYGGWCAWAMLDGEKVKIDPLSYKIINGKNYVFYNGFWGNTLDKWNEKALAETETSLVKTANAEWATQK